MRISDISATRAKAAKSKKVIDKSIFQMELEAAERKLMNEDKEGSYPHIKNGYRII
jgi:hypothetical protein